MVGEGVTVGQIPSLLAKSFDLSGGFRESLLCLPHGALSWIISFILEVLVVPSIGWFLLCSKHT